VGEAIGAALGEDEIVDETDPLVDGPVVGDDRGRGSVPFQNHLADVTRLLGDETPRLEVIGDEGVGNDEAAEAVMPMPPPGRGGLGWGCTSISRQDSARIGPSGWTCRDEGLKGAQQSSIPGWREPILVPVAGADPCRSIAVLAAPERQILTNSD